MKLSTDLHPTKKAAQLFTLFHSEITFKSWIVFGSRKAAKRCVLIHLNELTAGASPQEMDYIHEVQMAIESVDLSTL